MDLPRLLDAHDLWDRLVASDPTLERLRTGLRAVTGAAVSAAVLSRAGAAACVPPTVWLLGVSFAMGTALFVREGDARQERRALGLVTGVAAASASLAALTSAAPPAVGNAIALAVVFVAVWSRRFAAAGTGAGMAAFLQFFVARYFQLRPGQVSAAAAAVVAGGAIAYVVRFLLYPARPERAGPRTLAALRLTVATVLRRLEDSVMARPSPREAKRLGHDIDRLHEAALGVDDLIGRFPGPTLPSGLPVDTLRERVFELQLAAERVVQAVGQVVESGALPAAARRQVRAALEAARRIAIRAKGRRERIGPHLARAARLAREAGAPQRWRDDVRRLRTSLADLARAARWLREAIPERRLPAPAAAPLPPTAAPGPHGIPHPTRQAVQATIAAALAMVAGAQLSSTRWFWAVVAAFVMFSNATTVADTVSRAWLRVLGTVLGAGGGILLGAAVAGHPRLELAAAFACIFLAYWLFRVSYAWLLFWFTALIAVLYRLLGRYTPEIVVLRVEETLVGAAIGVVVAALVLPVRARTRVRALTAEVLRAVAAWLDVAVVARAAGRGDAPLDAARAMEDRLRALRAAARPLVGNRIASLGAAHLVHGATAVVLFARHLAPGEALAHLDPAALAQVSDAGRRLAARARWIAAELANGSGGGEAPDPGPAAEHIAGTAAALRGEAARRRGPTTPPVWLAWLADLDEALSDLAAMASRGSAGQLEVSATGAGSG